MKYKLLAAILVSLLFVLAPVSASSGLFSDIREGDWHHEYISKVNELGIMTGYKDGDEHKFKPDAPVTRAQIAKISALILEQQDQALAELLHEVERGAKVKEDTVVSLVAKSIPSVVKITRSGHRGAGFIIKHEGESNLVLTNHHVVSNEKHVEVVLSSGKSYVGEVLRTDPNNDIALIKIDEEDELNHLELATDIKQGSTIVSIGHHLGYDYTVTKGIISHTNRKGALQFDAANNAGGSGGPVLDADMKVVGMTRSKIVGEGVDNIAFAVRSDVISDFLDGKIVIYQ